MRPPIRFGTDGIRGPAGRWPLDAEGAELAGRAIAEWCGGGEVIVGHDGRASGPFLVSRLGLGLRAGGATVLDAGVLPTAALSAAVPARGAAAGVMVTASHNPASDNGVKVLGPDGRKLEDAGPVERLCDDPPPPRPPEAWGLLDSLPDPTRAWREAMPAVDLGGRRILLDCAHGAAAAHAPAVLRERGAELALRGCAPDGRNINDGVGALHPPTPEEVAAAGCELAICLDGDADRLVLVDARLGRLDGDDLLWLLAARVDGPLVGTVMSNGGLEAALGGRLLRAPVGDRHVARLMREHGARVGAEPSGHVLFADGLPTGDGLYTALRVLAACDGDLGAARGWTRWPVARLDLRYGEVALPAEARPDPAALPAVAAARARGLRVVARYSGTEPVFRVLVEGPEEAAARAAAEAVARDFRAALVHAPGSS